MHDGSGLAPQNAVSAKFLTDMLVYMHNRSNGSTTFLNSLPKRDKREPWKNFYEIPGWLVRWQPKVAASGGYNATRDTHRWEQKVRVCRDGKQIQRHAKRDKKAIGVFAFIKLFCP